MWKTVLTCRYCPVALLAPLTAALGPAGLAQEMPPKPEVWENMQWKLYAGPPVRDANDLAPWRGTAAAERIQGKDRRLAYELNDQQLAINYGSAVDYQLRRELVILCPQTATLLYDGFTPLVTRYRRGTRPELERVVADTTAGCRSDEEKALALMRFCRDLRTRDPQADFNQYIYGGTEEQLISKPDILCETLSRLMVGLCEIAGLPGRLVMHVLGGHITTEIRLEGQWAYIDPRCGMVFRRADGHLASVLDLWRDPSIIHRQNDAVKADVTSQWTWAFRAWKCENMYFNPYEVNGFENYSLADAGRYTYTQLPRQHVLDRGLMQINRAYVAAARRGLGLAPED